MFKPPPPPPPPPPRPPAPPVAASPLYPSATNVNTGSTMATTTTAAASTTTSTTTPSTSTLTPRPLAATNSAPGVFATPTSTSTPPTLSMSPMNVQGASSFDSLASGVSTTAGSTMTSGTTPGGTAGAGAGTRFHFRRPPARPSAAGVAPGGVGSSRPNPPAAATSSMTMTPTSTLGSLVPTTSPLTAALTGNRSRSTSPSGRFRLPPPLSSSPRITKLTTTTTTTATTTPLATVPFTSATAPSITSSNSTTVATTPAATVTTTPTTTKATLLMSSRISPGSLTPRAMMSVSSVFSASPNPVTGANAAAAVFGDLSSSSHEQQQQQREPLLQDSSNANGSGVATSGVADSTSTATTVTNVVAPFLPSLAVAPSGSDAAANPTPSTSSNAVAPPLAPRTEEVHQQGPQGQALGVADTATATSINKNAVAATAPKEQKEEEGCWQELVDPSTGRTYYYNANTNATTWEKPVAEAATLPPPGTTITADASINSIAETEAAVERATASTMTMQSNPSVVVPVDDNNPAVVAAAAETPNVTTSGLASSSSTSADNKQQQQTQQQEVSSTTTNVNGDALLLPEGWTELTDPSSGKVYYYHSASHVSTWDRPVVRTSASNDGPTPPPPLPPSSPKQHEQEVVQPVDEVANEEKEAMTKESVTRFVDSAVTSTDTIVQGKIIIQEEVQKQQSTTTVEANQDGNDRRENKESLLLKDIKEEVAAPPSSSRHLPEGWEEGFDPSSGQVYYYRASDNLKTWERPVAPAARPPPPRRPPPPKQKPINNKHQPDDDDESFVIVEHPAPPPQKQHRPPPPPPVTKQGDVKNEVKMTVPPDATNMAALTPTPPPPNGFSAARIEAVAPAPIPSRPLPPQPDASRPLPPPPPAADAAPRPLPPQPVASRPPTGAAPRPPPPLPTTSTTPPSTAPPSSLSAPPLFVSPFADGHNKIADDDHHHQQNHVPLPEGWQECEDPSTGRVYYRHEKSNTTAWERPTDATPGNDQVLEHRAFSTDAEESKRETPLSSLLVEVSAADSVTLGGEAASSDIQPQQQELLQPLPDGWQERQDTATGQVYYFHEGTCTTTWERPGAGPTIVDQEVETATSANEMIAIMAASEEESGRENNVTAASVTDNHEVLTTIVAPASDFVAATESATDLPLPEGWQECEDTASGRVYYYHEIDCITTWERPSLVPASIPPEHQEETIAKESKTMHEIGEPSLFAGFHGDSTARVEGDLRPDETTGAVAPPPPPAITKEEQEFLTAQVADVAEFAAGTFAASGNGHDDVLPEGWQALQDPSTGQLYYYHEGDNITRWDRPLVHAVEKNNSELLKDDAELEVQAKFDSQDSTKVVAAHRPEIHEPYVDDLPLAAPQKLEDDFNPLLEDPTSSSKSNNNDKLPPPLPEGWQEFIDESSGRPFYSHAADGITTWDRPVEKETGISLVVDTVPPYQDEPVDALTGDVSQGAGEDEFADGEKQQQRENEMCAEDLVGVDEGKHDSRSSLLVDLPQGWEEVVDEALGQVYYYNASQDITTWERPTVATTRVAASSEDEAGVAIADEADVRTSALSLQSDFGEAAAPSAKTEAAACWGTDAQEEAKQQVFATRCSPEYVLPDGWQELEDPTSGQIYYFHADDNVTTWERPTLPHTMEQEQAQKELEDAPRHDEPMEPNGETEGKAEAAEASEVSATDRESIGAPNAISSQQVEVDATGKNSLPDGWEEVVDETTGEVYYFNEATNMSTWDRPQDDVAVDEQKEEEPTIALDGESEGAAVDGEPKTETLLTSKDPLEGEEVAPDGHSFQRQALPDGWEEGIDPDSGLTYYFHVDGTTSWERPDMESDEGEIVVPDLSTLSTPDASGIGKAHAPQKDSDDTDDDAEDDQTEVARNKTGGQNDVDEAPISDRNVTMEDEGQLPDGWQAIVDPSSGRTYYYNEQENLTMWDRPDSEIKENAVLDIADTADGAVPDELLADTNNLSGKSSSRLPEGWEEMVDEDSGNIYYYNARTETATWELPVEEVKLQSIEGLPAAVAPEIEHEEVCVPKKSEVTAKVDDHVFEETPELQVEESAGELPVNSQMYTGNDLPDGWEEVVDPSSGQVYYYCEAQQISSWERPVGVSDRIPLEPSLSKDATMKVIDMGITGCEPESAPEETSTAPTTSCSLPGGWTEVTDPTTGQQYYVHDDGTTSWERPAEQSETGFADDNALNERTGLIQNDFESSASGLLPDGWTEVVDEASGDLFFYNESMNLKTRERPRTEQLNKLPIPDEAAEFPPEWTEAEEKRAGELKATETSADTPLPQGWIELVDSSTMRTYFYNEQLNETCWDRPVGFSTASENSSLERNSVVQKLETKLAEGWEEITDPSTGSVYFYNAETGESTWNRPLSKTIPLDRKKAGRPAHSFAAFGFGGRLCVLSRASGVSTRVAIHRTASLVKSDPIVEIENSKVEANFSGCLASACEENVLSYIKKRSATPNGLLWRLILIAAHANGKLRSDRPMGDPKCPEAAVSKLLSEDGTANEALANRGLLTGISSTSTSTEPLDLGTTFDLILAGRSEEAAKEAARNRCFALSLILASMCGPKMYEQAIANYAHSELAAGSPFYTLCMLLSGQVKPSLQIWGEELASLRYTWKSHLAAILNVRGKGWELFAVSLGDALKSIEETEASHFCYVVCGCPIASPARKDSRLTLIGRDVGSSDLTLTTDESLSAFEKTEAYEWAKLRSKPNASIESLQPFKLMYAMLLADYGFEDAASNYVRSLKLFIGAPKSSTQKPLGPLSLAMLSCDRQSLLAYLEAFEARLRMRCSSENEDSMKRCSSENEDSRRLVHTLRESDTRDSFMSARSSASLIPSDDLSLDESGKGSRRQQLPEVSQDENHPTHVHSLPGILESPAIDNGPKGFDLTIINPPLFPQERQSNDVSSRSQALVTPKMSDSKLLDQTPITAVTPSDAPLKPPKAPMSAPANLQQGRTSTPSSGKKAGFFSFGIRDIITQYLNPDAVQVKDLGESMQAYYDEKRKVWVFPGDDPDEVAKPVGPPPTTPQAVASTTPTTPAAATATNDPLAAMMAPPKRGPTSLKQKSKPAAATPSRIAGMPLPGIGDLKAGPPMMAAPPQFAVFTPSPSATK